MECLIHGRGTFKLGCHDEHPWKVFILLQWLTYLLIISDFLLSFFSKRLSVEQLSLGVTSVYIGVQVYLKRV